MLYLIGGAGNGNFGDELIVKGWLEFIANTGYQGPVIFDENHARISQSFFGSLYPDVTFTDEISRLKRQGPDGFFASLVRGLRFYANGGFGQHPQLKHLAELFATVKVLHLHGGGYINTIWPKNAFLLGFAAATKARYGCRIVGTGLGVLPAAAPPEKHLADVREVLEAFDILELRDRWSFDYLKGISDSPRILFGLDDSYLIRRAAAEAAPRTLHYSYFVSADHFDRVLAHAAGPEPARFERILFWSCTNQDSNCFEQIAAVCPRAERVSWETLVREPIPVAPGDMMVTARFHPHLLAARHGAHGVFRKDRGYYDVKHGSVVDLGSPFIPMGEEIIGAEPTEFNAIHAFDDMRIDIKRRLATEIYGKN